MPKKLSLAERIRRLDGKMPRAQIARKLGTSPDYVRVVLNHRVCGGRSKYDVAYQATDVARAKRRAAQKAAYAIVPKAERVKIYKQVGRPGAMTEIRRKGRRMLAEMRDDGNR